MPLRFIVVALACICGSCEDSCDPSNPTCVSNLMQTESDAVSLLSLRASSGPPDNDAERVHRSAYCTNRGGSSGSNEFSKNVGTYNTAACTAYVASIRGCGQWFDYGEADGWCDCVPVGEECSVTGYGQGGYAVFKFGWDNDARPEYSTIASNSYCSNRGGHAGKNKFSTNVGTNDIGDGAEKCAIYCSSVEGTGMDFDYGGGDGQCDCVPIGSTCTVTAYNQGNYGTYRMKSKVRRSYTIADLTNLGAYCTNRGGTAGRNKFSKNVGVNNINGCAKYVANTPGCGKWFDYGKAEGWCDCVPDPSDCTAAGYGRGDYSVYKFTSDSHSR